MNKELESLDNEIKKLKDTRDKKAAELLNRKYAGKYLTIDWTEEGFISMRVDKINPGFNDKVEIQGLIVGNWLDLQDWTEYMLGITESYYINTYNLAEDAKEITKEQFITDCRESVKYLSNTIEEFIND